MTSTPPELDKSPSTPLKSTLKTPAKGTGLSAEDKKKLGKKVGIVAALLGTLAVGIPIMNSLSSSTEKVEPQQETKALSPAPGTLPTEAQPALNATPVAASGGVPLPNAAPSDTKPTPVVKDIPSTDTLRPAPPVVTNSPPTPATSKPIMAVESTSVRAKPSNTPQTEEHPATKSTPAKTTTPRKEETAAAPPQPAKQPAPPVVAAAPAATKPIVLAQADPKSFNVQLGLFRDHNNAVALMNRLKENGIPAYLETRVQLGPFNSKQDAEATVTRLKEKGVKGVIVPGS